MVLRATGATVTTTAPEQQPPQPPNDYASYYNPQQPFPHLELFDDTHCPLHTVQGGLPTQDMLPDLSRYPFMSLPTTGATYSFPFVGNSFTLLWSQVQLKGQFSVSIDGGAPTTVSAYNSTEVRSVPLERLPHFCGSHNAVITVLGKQKKVVPLATMSALTR